MRFAGAIFVAFVCVSAPALGAGYEVKEHSADAMAAAYAGAAATGSDASYLAYNPAAAAYVANTDFSFSVVEILPGSNGTYGSAKTSAGNATGGSLDPRGFISDATVPALAFRQRLSDRWTFGLSITSPWGLRTDYPENWTGRYYALKTELLTLNATPVLSYQLTPELAIAAGPQVEYAQGTLTSAIDTGTLGALNSILGSVPGAQDSYARVSAKNWSYGYTLGAIDHLSESLTVGLSYRSSIRHDLRGPLTFTLDSAGVGATIRSLTGLFTNTRSTTPVTMPDTASFGARQDFSDRWTGLLEVDWTGWSHVGELSVMAANPLQPADVTALHWHDAWFGSVGAEYRADPRWTFRGGVAFDHSSDPGCHARTAHSRCGQDLVVRRHELSLERQLRHQAHRFAPLQPDERSRARSSAAGQRPAREP